MIGLKLVLQVGRLDDLMVFHQSFVTKEPVNVHCLCRTLLLNYAIASALAYILRNAVWSVWTIILSQHLLTLQWKLWSVKGNTQIQITTKAQRKPAHNLSRENSKLCTCVCDVQLTLFLFFFHSAWVTLVEVTKNSGA